MPREGKKDTQVFFALGVQRDGEAAQIRTRVPQGSRGASRRCRANAL
jgi:hypothetical protein